MPTPECWQDIGQNFGRLAAKMDDLKDEFKKHEDRQTQELAELKNDVSDLKVDRARMTAIGAVAALILPGIGVIFGEPIRLMVKNLFR